MTAATPIHRISDEAVERHLRLHAARQMPDGVLLVNGSEVRPTQVKWLWPGWMAQGKLHILAGAPGQGKTTLSLALAATVTSGGRWPDGSRCPPANVLIWSGEDDVADTLLPRLLAMGADPKRITFIAGTRENGEVGPFDPARDLVQLSAAAESIGNIAMMIVDPVVSAVGGDSHKNGEVRKALQPLVHLASVLEAAVLGITHFSKGTSGREPTERVTGSVAFGAVARVVMVAAKVNKADGDRRVFARSKSNIGPDNGGFEYEVAQADVPNHPGFQVATINWGNALDGTARELLAEAEQSEADDDSGTSALDAAVEFLEAELADGPVSAATIFAHARQAGCSEITVRRAKKHLDVEAKKGHGAGKGWMWHPTAKMIKAITNSESENHDHLDHLDRLEPQNDDDIPF